MTRLGEPSLHHGGHPMAPDPDGMRVGLVPVVATGAALVATSFVVGGMLSGGIGEDRLHQWLTVFLALVLQALPFLVLGTVLAGVVSAYLKPTLVSKLVPRNPIAAVGVAGLAGAALPGCECSSVPLARRLAARGVPTPAALSFLLAAPAVNPVVVVATPGGVPRPSGDRRRPRR